VQFAVVGSGVGVVELRARYEPAPLPAAAGIDEFESSTSVLFVAPALPTLNLIITPNASLGTPGLTNQGVTVGTGTAAGTSILVANAAIGSAANGSVAPGGTGTITVTFTGGTPVACSSGGPLGTIFCVDPTTGLPITRTGGSGLSGEVIIEIDRPDIAFLQGTTPGTTPVFASTATTPELAVRLNRIAVRCGAITTSVVGFENFFQGCSSVAVGYQGNNPGLTAVRATFVPDLPGAFGGTTTFGLPNRVSAFFDQFPGIRNAATATGTITVTGGATAGQIALARGCNNITPTVTESAAAFANRVAPAGALVSIFEYQAATNTFLGFSPLAGAPNDLATVTRLRPVFICVNAAAVLNQPVA